MFWNDFGEFENVSEVLHHPMLRQLQDRRLESIQEMTPLAKIRGESVDLGSHIKLKLQPAVIYCHITKGVQKAALHILARRIKEHSLAADTRIYMQHGPKGKYKYYLWLPTTKLNTHTLEQLFEKLVHLTKIGRRAVTLVIKQSILKGPIHNIWATQYSLL